MKTSIYRTTDDIYLAIQTDGQQIMRGSLSYLANVLRGKVFLSRIYFSEIGNRVPNP